MSVQSILPVRRVPALTRLLSDDPIERGFLEYVIHRVLADHVSSFTIGQTIRLEDTPRIARELCASDRPAHRNIARYIVMNALATNKPFADWFFRGDDNTAPEDPVHASSMVTVMLHHILSVVHNDSLAVSRASPFPPTASESAAHARGACNPAAVVAINNPFVTVAVLGVLHAMHWTCAPDAPNPLGPIADTAAAAVSAPAPTHPAHPRLQNVPVRGTAPYSTA